MKPYRLYILVLATALLCALTSRAATPKISAEHYAILRGGDAKQLTEALDHGLDANARDAQGNTPIMWAAVYGDANCIRRLLARHADVNVTNNAGSTPLLRASFDYTKARLLIDAGAEINKASNFGNTPLMLAARVYGNHRTVELILARGAKPNATNRYGASALMAAAASEDSESVRLLLKHGANVNAAPALNNLGMIFGGGRTALMWSAYRDDIGSTRRLVDAGAEVDAEAALGTALSQAAWGDRLSTLRLLLDRGANVNQSTHSDGYTPLHWAASIESEDTSLVKLLLARGANPNAEGGQHVDAFRGTPQTPLMLARRRGDTAIVAALLAAGATNETPDRVRSVTIPERNLPDQLDVALLQQAVSRAVPPLARTSVSSREAYLKHASRQDCTSCHQQHLPLTAMGLARKFQVTVDGEAEGKVKALIRTGDVGDAERDWQTLFHPEPAHGRGYLFLAHAAQDVPPNEFTDSWVHQLALVQGKDGRWFNNLPRPPIQTSDVGATALSIYGLQRYGLPGRKAEFAKRVERAKRWLWNVTPANNEERIHQLLGLAWAGETAKRLQPLAAKLSAQQRSDGGWAQLPHLRTDAYATGQALYALHFSIGLGLTDPGFERGVRFLLKNQLEDGTWHVPRRTFPFQPTTIPSEFPHGRDAWISAAATSWAVMALSLATEPAPTLRAAK